MDTAKQGEKFPEHSQRARELRENRDILDDAVGEWHAAPEDGRTLHEVLGVSWEEYVWIMEPVDWVENRENYIDFMDYLVRNAEEL